MIDAVKVADKFEQEGINFTVNPQSNTVYVSYEDNPSARLLLAKIGIVNNYPHYAYSTDEPPQSGKAIPIIHQAWFMKLIKQSITALAIIIIIMIVMKPLLRILIYPEDSGIRRNNP